MVEVITLSDTDSDATTEDWESSSSSEEDIQVISERIRKRSSARQCYEKDKPTGSLVRSMIVESSLKRSRNGGVTGKITGKEIVTLDGARGRDDSRNKGQSLKGKYRWMDTIRWTKEN